MGTNPNTLSTRTIWSLTYQITHNIMPVYKAFATERLAAVLGKGATVKRTYGSDLIVNEMGGDGSYSTQGVTDADESLTVDQKPEVSIQIPDWQQFQTHLDTKQYYAGKAMNRIWNYIDGYLLNKMIYAADYAAVVNSTPNVIDNGIISGAVSDGAGITISVGNIVNIFTAATQQLIKNNVTYVPNKKFTGKKSDMMDKMPVAAITPEAYAALLLYTGNKNSMLGDKATTNGYIDYFMGFNVFVSNNLPWSAVLAFSTNPSAGDTFKLGISSSVYQTFRFYGSLGQAGDILQTTSAAATATATAAALNAPHTTSATYYGLTAGTYTAASTTATYNGVMTQANAMKLFFKNTFAWVASATATSVYIQVAGFGPCYIALGTNAAANTLSTTSQQMHCLFGCSQSIDLILQARPNLRTNFVSSSVAKDLITWTLFGAKVFNDQVPQLIDVQLLASTAAQPTFTLA